MITYPSRLIQANKLAQLVANELKDAIEEGGIAGLVLSGGSTPRQFIQSLSQLKIDWSKLTVTISDERWVGIADERSNARMVKELLRIDDVQHYSFVPLFMENSTPREAIPILELSLKEKLPIVDSVVLGMGTDGHTASLFPGADNLDQALSLDNTRSLIPIVAPGAPEQRISLTLAKIVSAKQIHLLINGVEKLETLQVAQQLNDPLQMPICALLELENLTIHYAD